MKFINIALRNLSRQKKRNILLCSAIAFGILMITLVNSFTNGVTSNIKESFSDLFAGHIYISQETKRDDGEVIEEFKDEKGALQILQELGYDEQLLVRRSNMTATLIFNGRESTQLVFGVNWDREDKLRNRINLSSGSIEEALADPRGIVISGNVAEDLEVEIGEEITITTSTVTGQRNVGTFVVQGIMVDSSFLGSISSYAHVIRVNEMINIPPESYQTLSLFLSGIEEVDTATSQFYEVFQERVQLKDRDANNNSNGRSGGFALSLTFQDEEEEPWEGTRYVIENINDFTTQIDQLAQTFNGIGLGVLVISVLITMVGVTNTFRMLMLERVKEIGTMRAIGVQRKGIQQIFLWEAFGLGTLGYILGIFLAIIASLIIRLFDVPSESPFNIFTMNGTLTFPFNFISLMINYIIIVGFTILSANLSASKAARLNPADSLRS